MPATLDLDLDLDLDLGTRGGGGDGPRMRYNTDDFPKLMPPAPAAKVPVAKYKANWNLEYRAWTFVREFIVNCFGGTAITTIMGEYNKQNIFPVPYSAGGLYPLTDADLSTQVLKVLNASIGRSDRARESASQDSGACALRYWSGLLRLDS